MSVFPDLHVFVISLPGVRPRRDYICQHLSELGLAFEVYDGVDGHHLSPSQRSAYGAVEARARLGRDLLPGEIGCALSHIGVFRTIVERRIEEALVLEDDAVLSTDTIEVLRRRATLQKDRDVVLLHHQGDSGPTPRGAEISAWGRIPIWDRFHSGRFVEHAWSTGAYLITQAGAKKLLQVAHPIWSPIDQLTGTPGAANLRLYGIRPPCVGEKSLPSTMEGRTEAQVELLSKRQRDAPLRQKLAPLAGRLGYGKVKRFLVLSARKLLPPEPW